MSRADNGSASAGVDFGPSNGGAELPNKSDRLFGDVALGDLAAARAGMRRLMPTRTPFASFN